MKTWLSAAASAAVIMVTAAIAQWYFAIGEPAPLNVVVVSACSLRADRVGGPLSPRLNEWAKGAFTFTNAIAEKPWQNFTFEGNERMTRQLLAGLGYAPFRSQKQGYHFIIPPVETTAGDEEWFWSEDAILKYTEPLNNLRQVLTKKRERSIYAFIHLKYMHYPYLDTVNITGMASALSPTSRELLARYTSRPADFEAQLPMIEVLLNNFDLLKKKYGVKDVFSVAGVISDPARARRWQATAGYRDDLNLVTELYDLKMRHFDGMAADVLNLFDDPDLQKNTVVIFTGDHGVLGHSVNVYDEMLRYPLLVKFPGGGGGGGVTGGILDQQINHTILAEMVEQILQGKITAKNFAAEAEKRPADHVLTRNCQGDIRAVRYRSEWKFIKNLATNKSELYDLRADPAETRNLAGANPEMAWNLEQYLISHQAEFARTTVRERKSKVCNLKL